MGSVKPSVRYRNAGAPSTVLQSSAGSNGVVTAVPVGNGNHVNHLRNELSEFEKEDFDAQGYVQAKCQSMSEKVHPWTFAFLRNPNVIVVVNAALLGSLLGITVRDV